MDLSEDEIRQIRRAVSAQRGNWKALDERLEDVQHVADTVREGGTLTVHGKALLEVMVSVVAAEVSMRRGLAMLGGEAGLN